MVVFDLDGTLIDSMPVLRGLGIAAIVKHYGLDEPTAAHAYDSTVGLPFRMQLDKLSPLTPALNMRVANEYGHRHEAVASEFTLAVGLRPALRWVQRHAQTALITSTKTEIVMGIRALHGLAFDYVYGVTSELPNKGAQFERLKKDMKKDAPVVLVSNSPFVYVGDTKHDAELAEEWGLPFVHVTPENVAARLVSNVLPLVEKKRIRGISA